MSLAGAADSTFDTVLVVDFGAQYAQLIARRVRECHVYSEIVPSTMPVEEMLAKEPKAIILSGGPASVYTEGAPQAPRGLFQTGLPTFGICYGFQAMVQDLGGTVARTGLSEFGRTSAELGTDSVLFAGLPATQSVWMSHGDSVTEAPDGFRPIGSTAGAPVAAVEDPDRALFGVQFHPEVLHTEHGQAVMRRFLYEVAGCRPTWTMLNIVEEQVERVRAQVGDKRVICALSGGVDSAVAGALVQRAVGEQLTCVFVDHGLLRKGEAEQVEKDFVAATGAVLKIVDAQDRFLGALAGVHDPEEKRAIIGREFIRSSSRPPARWSPRAAAGARRCATWSRARSTRTWSSRAAAAAPRTSSRITTSAGFPRTFGSPWSNRSASCSRTRSARWAEELGLPVDMVWRQPFPGPGLAIRIIGDVTRERLEILRAADGIAREELSRAGLDRDIWQCPVVLLADVRSVGVQGDGRTYGHPVVLRPVSSEDAMTADWSRVPYEVLATISNRITNEVREINRVTLDVTSKPPGTIEWE